MFIKLKVKSEEELENLYPNWRETEERGFMSRGPFAELWRARHVWGQEADEAHSGLYKSFEDIPEKAVVNGYKLEKRFLDWRPSESKDVHIVSNGLIRQIA